MKTVVPLTINNNIKHEATLKANVVETKSATANNILLKTSTLINGDSDSVVSDSCGEEAEQAYVHVAKRRRVLKTIEKNQTNEKSVLPAKNTDINELKAIAIQKESSTSEAHQEDVKFYDFSADDIDDADYSPPKAKKGARKTVKTVKKTATTKGQRTTNHREAKQKTKENGKNTTNSQITRRTRGNYTKKGTPKDNIDVTVTNVEELNEVPEEKPPEAAMLRYTMLLESCDLTNTPRVPSSELEKADDVAQRYINSTHLVATKAETAASNHKPTLAPIIDEKRAAARKKLEKKIAAGKLNENYVSINLQKKVYARGKRNVNYSKYKKKLWRHKKKIAALAGPDMDMGGCDGGVLTCFTCGQVGHFAAQCKIKGDALLPLTAQLEEDPSPFPTLEEAEHMAAQIAVVAHSRNISKLPAAANTAMYQTNEEDTECEQKPHKNSDHDGTVDQESIAVKGGNDDVSEGYDHDSEDDDNRNMYFESDEEFENINIDEVTTSATQASPIKKYVGHKIPEDFLKKVGLYSNSENGKISDTHFGGIIPIYELDADGNVREDIPAEVTDALRMFGHTNFRKGQERAIMRILSGVSTLVTLSTGSGKSLCYQLPAYLYSHRRRAITLVISPLVSLMEDQVTGVPHFLRAHCLHTNQTPQQRIKVMEMISAGEVDILLVSPEAVVAGERSTGFGAILRQLPPIAFACIDEAHCVSQWSHNFRPSYLMICKVLKKNLGVQTVLGLTATATLPTRLSIINHLGIPDGERGVISDTPLPDNLLLSASKDENKDAALLELLLSDR